jgi:PAP2 superfamily protein
MLNLELSWQQAAITSGCLFVAAAVASAAARTTTARARTTVTGTITANTITANTVTANTAGAGGRPRLRAAAAIAAEAGTLLGLFALWQFAGSFSVFSPDGAIPRARWIWHAERLTHLPSEAAVQQVFLPHPLLVQTFNLYYLGLHFPVLIACLIWLFARHRQHYPRIRTTIVIFTAVSLLIQFLPVAPPRMLPGDHMVDTAARYGQSVYGTGFDADQLSAMPSVHVGWAIIVALAVIAVCRSRWRWLALGYPVLTTLVVVVTANHFWLDAIAAAALLGLVLLAQVSFAAWRPWRRAGAAAAASAAAAAAVEARPAAPSWPQPPPGPPGPPVPEYGQKVSGSR